MNFPDLETPQIIEELSLGEILEQMRNKLIEIEPEFTAYLESDPLIKLMEIAARNENLNQNCLELVLLPTMWD